MADQEMTTISRSVQRTEEILKLIQDELELTDRQHAYHALRSVLTALRDRLPIDEATDLGAQLPVLMRGIYYEGWKPADTPVKWNGDEFLEEVAHRYHVELQKQPEDVVRAVWKTLKAQVSNGEIGDLLSTLPEDVIDFLEERG